MKKNVAKKEKIILIFLLIFLLFKKVSIKVMYYISKNFGDNLNYFLLKDMVDGEINFYELNTRNLNNENIDDNKTILKLNRLGKINFLFIGSILNTICNWLYFLKNPGNLNKSIISKWYFKIYDYIYPLIIFGSGFISSQKYKNETYMRNLKIISVRGNETLQRLVNNGIKISKNVILADPGILAPFLINITNFKDIDINKKYSLCVIPHEIDRSSSLIYNKIKIKNFALLNIRDNPIKFLSSIVKCKRVLSSGLHALIISDSLGIPNMRIVISNKITGGDYKFKDYYSAYNLKLPSKIDLRKSTFTLKEFKYIYSNHRISLDMIRQKQCQLLFNFPYPLKEKYNDIKNKICK